MLEWELAQWRRLGRRPLLWWRDDDAREPTPSLDRLLDLAGTLPLSLAIVPDGDLRPLAERLSRAANLTISQHGVSHRNCRAAGPPSEFPEGASVAAVAEAIRGARLHMERAGLEPCFFTPPWNEIDLTLSRALGPAGVCRLSAASQSRAVDHVLRIDSDLDILRWKPRSRFRGQARVTLRLAQLLRDRRRSGNFAAPIGLLTHHLAHDEPAWLFLSRFLDFARTRFAWRSYQALAGTA